MKGLATTSQFRVLAEILEDIAQVSLAGAVVPPLIAGLDSEKIPVFISGLFVSTGCWILSLVVAKRVEL